LLCQVDAGQLPNKPIAQKTTPLISRASNPQSKSFRGRKLRGMGLGLRDNALERGVEFCNPGFCCPGIRGLQGLLERRPQKRL
jgi:hypothetical protein